MDEAELVKVGAALIGGGAAGAIITAIVTSYRNRIQPVRYRMKTVPVFSKAPRSSTIETVVTLRANGQGYDFANLHLTELSIVNSGNQNIKEFTIGITMSNNDRIVNAHCEAPDRQHNGSQVGEITPADPKQAVDFKLIPFNRQDAYQFRLLSTSANDREPGEIKLSSSEPVRFVARIDIGETLGRSSLEIAVELVAKSVGAKFR
jgi:hypothetical protein